MNRILLLIAIFFTHLYDFLRRLVMFSAMNDDSFEHGVHEFRIPLFKIDLPVRVTEDFFCSSRKRPKVFYVWQYTAFVPTIDFRVA